MRIEPAELLKTVRAAVAALDSDIIEAAARIADAEAERLEQSADREHHGILCKACKELRAGARAARRIAIGIRALKEAP